MIIVYYYLLLFQLTDLLVLHFVSASTNVNGDRSTPLVDQVYVVLNIEVSWGYSGKRQEEIRHRMTVCSVVWNQTHENGWSETCESLKIVQSLCFSAAFGGLPLGFRRWAMGIYDWRMSKRVALLQLQSGVFSSFIFFLWGGGMKNNRKCLLISKKLETLRVKDI